ncbi:MAG TPA: hypothetical protein PLV59_03175 [Candidatus Dojkabacteria bacterium]|nr:hypothetical protein [Candidatus Dojkabacteria bacterium]
MGSVHEEWLEKFIIDGDVNVFDTQDLSPSMEREIEDTKMSFKMARFIVGKEPSLMMYGGNVRNLILGIGTSQPDYDFIGDFDPDYIQNNFREFFVDRWDEVSTLRLNIFGRIFDFTWASDIQERLSINDINISNICLTEMGELIDYFGGIKSMQEGEIKIDDPFIKIENDPTRILRVIRFAAELGFKIEEETWSSIVSNSPKLLSSDIPEEDIVQIASLDAVSKQRVYEYLIKIGRFDIFQRLLDIRTTPQIFQLESVLNNNTSIKDVARMFPQDLLLVGGAVRDTIWGKRVNDFDFKIHTDVNTVIDTLERHGFRLRDDYNTAPGEYYISIFPGVVGVNINGVDIHISTASSFDLSEMIANGDLNFNCCAYDPHSMQIVNPEVVRQIAEKELRFANPANAVISPTIIFNALKQISRIPDITIPDETDAIIRFAIPQVVKFFSDNPHMHYLLNSLMGNLNTSSVLEYFSEEEKYIFNSITQKRELLKVGSHEFHSIGKDSLDPNDHAAILDLMKKGYGDHFDENKLFSGNVDSVIMKVSDGEIISCTTVDGERLYSVAAKSALEWARVIQEASAHNYNVWGTVDAGNTKVLALCHLGGLKIEMDPQVVNKILTNNTTKYRNGVCIEIRKGFPVFWNPEYPDDYPQVLVRS